jgi:hypothetical protein
MQNNIPTLLIVNTELVPMNKEAIGEDQYAFNYVGNDGYFHQWAHNYEGETFMIRLTDDRVFTATYENNGWLFYDVSALYSEEFQDSPFFYDMLGAVK